MTSGFLLNCSPPHYCFFFRNGLPLNLELTNWLDLASQAQSPQGRDNKLMLPHLACFCFFVVLGIQTQVLMLAQKALY